MIIIKYILLLLIYSLSIYKIENMQEEYNLQVFFLYYIKLILLTLLKIF